MNQDKTFIHCEKCGKRLIARLPNGLYHFVFGKRIGNDTGPPVEVFIHGSLKIRCLRRSCGHMNVLTYFPHTMRDNQPKAEDPEKALKNTNVRG